MITAEMAAIETRQAVEDELEEQIISACKSGKNSVGVDRSLLPEWLRKKLEESGYTIEEVNDARGYGYSIHWG